MSNIERDETDSEFSFIHCKLQRRLDNNYCMYRPTMTSSSWKEMQFPQGRIWDINRRENVNLKHSNNHEASYITNFEALLEQ